MRSLIAALALVLVSSLALAQPRPPDMMEMTIGSVDPTGACTVGRVYTNTTSGHMWWCYGATWHDVAATAGVSWPLGAPSTTPSFTVHPPYNFALLPHAGIWNDQSTGPTYIRFGAFGTNAGDTAFSGFDASMIATGGTAFAQIGMQARDNDNGTSSVFVTSQGETVWQMVNATNMGNFKVGPYGPRFVVGVGGKPACSVTYRGYVWYTEGGAGVTDALEICRKDAANAYAWTALY